MKKIRRIQKYGDSFAIKLEPTDLPDMDWKVGDLLDITDVVKVNKRSSNK
jgi:hypothetical protein